MQQAIISLIVIHFFHINIHILQVKRFGCLLFSVPKNENGWHLAWHWGNSNVHNTDPWWSHLCAVCCVFEQIKKMNSVVMVTHFYREKRCNDLITDRQIPKYDLASVFPHGHVELLGFRLGTIVCLKVWLVNDQHWGWFILECAQFKYSLNNSAFCHVTFNQLFWLVAPSSALYCDDYTMADMATMSISGIFHQPLQGCLTVHNSPVRCNSTEHNTPKNGKSVSRFHTQKPRERGNLLEFQLKS